jgi:acyl-CoA synthetase (AMP-forming)/AMP-acid ligase II
VHETAAALHHIGAKRGDVLAMYHICDPHVVLPIAADPHGRFAPNCIDYALVFHACSLFGIIVSPVAPNFQAAELRQQIQVSHRDFQCYFI